MYENELNVGHIYHIFNIHLLLHMFVSKLITVLEGTKI